MRGGREGGRRAVDGDEMKKRRAGEGVGTRGLRRGRRA